MQTEEGKGNFYKFFYTTFHKTSKDEEYVMLMTGDTLTAFAPNTTGIPYLKNKDSMSMKTIKQLYDIGNLDSTIVNTIVRRTVMPAN